MISGCCISTGLFKTLQNTWVNITSSWSKSGDCYSESFDSDKSPTVHHYCDSQLISLCLQFTEGLIEKKTHCLLLVMQLYITSGHIFIYKNTDLDTAGPDIHQTHRHRPLTKKKTKKKVAHVTQLRQLMTLYHWEKILL